MSVPHAISSFELTRSDDGRYQFVLVGSNGRIIATSPQYRMRESAIRAIEAVRASAPGALFEDRTGTGD